MDAYAPAGQTQDMPLSTPQNVPDTSATPTSAIVPATAPQPPAAPTTATGFLRQLPTTVPWWGWGLAGLAVGWAIGSRR